MPDDNKQKSTRRRRGPGRPRVQFAPSIEFMERAEQLLGKEWQDITDEDFESLSAEQREELSQL